MIKKLSIAALTLLILVSCSSRKKAFNYSQDIVKKEQSLTIDITTTEEKVAAFFNAEQYDSVAAAGERMEKLVDTKLNEVKNTPAPEVAEGDSFKEASVKYFAYIKSLYTSYKAIGLAPSAEAREKEMDKLRVIVNQKTAAIAGMQTAQKKFAEANKFKLESKP